jgi:hypothetical protein
MVRDTRRTMVSGYRVKNYKELIFLLLQTILYLVFLFLDITCGSIGLSVGIKYTIIILCFCYALLAGSASKSIVFLLQAGLLFTLIADLFILVLDYYLYGVFAFILVQQLYSLRLAYITLAQRGGLPGSENNKGRVRVLTIYLKRLVVQFGIAVIVCLLVLFAGVDPDSLLVASVIYFISILTNTISAVRLACTDIHHKNNLLYGIGMLLFLLCDINVGLFNLSGFIAMPEDIYSVIYSYSSILMWSFYAPSQVLIAISSHYSEKRRI